MKLSTKIYIALYVLTLVPTFFLGGYVFDIITISPSGVEFNLTLLSGIGLALVVINNVFGTILFIRFLHSQRLSGVIFFSSLPLSLIYGGGIFLFAGLNLYTNIPLFAFISSTLKISPDNYNSLLWAILLTILYLFLMFLIYFFACRPIHKLERITHRLGDGRVNQERFDVGKSKQFKNIEASLEKINYNYREKDNLARQTDLEAQKFIPKEFLRFLGKNSITELELGHQVQKKATILYCDFVSNQDKPLTLSLEENFNFLSSYLSIISPIIRKFGGFIDKYLQNSILAVFSRPENAIECSTAICRAIEIKNRSMRYSSGIDVRIAIHTSDLAIGIIGDEERKYPSVITDVLNLSTKMEEVGKLIGGRVIFTKAALNDIPTNYDFDYRYIGYVSAGEGEGAGLFENLLVYPRRKRERLVHLKNTFEQGVRALSDGEYEKARDNFKDVLKYVSDDKASYVYFNKACDKLD